MAVTRVALALIMLACSLTPFLADDSPEAEAPAGTWAPDSGDGNGPNSSASLSFALLNRYVWRGLLLTDGPVIQPEVEVTHRGFFVNVWSNLDLDDVNGNEREINEVDLTFGYDHDLGLASISGGVVHYTFSAWARQTSPTFATP